jgi:crossover junction endodeoxyribonuclease RuvC
MLHCGALFVAAKRQKESCGAALQDVHALLTRLIGEFRPNVMAVEAVFAALNVRTALRLAEVRGVVLLAAAQNNVAVYSYSPREVKSSVTGYGHADKRQVQQMVRALLKMAELPEPADAADALAVALCHLQTEQLKRKFNLDGVGKPVSSSASAAFAQAAGTAKTYATRRGLTRILSTR